MAMTLYPIGYSNLPYTYHILPDSYGIMPFRLWHPAL